LVQVQVGSRALTFVAPSSSSKSCPNIRKLGAPASPLRWLVVSSS
jgi:hypothetical protein